MKIYRRLGDFLGDFLGDRLGKYPLVLGGVHLIPFLRMEILGLFSLVKY